MTEDSAKGKRDIYSLDDLIIDDQNANQGTERGMWSLQESLIRFGVGRGVLVDRLGQVIGGNKTIETLAKLNPDVLVQIPLLRAQYFEFRGLGKNGTCRLILANAIMLMCRSPKARTADHFQRVVTQQWVEDSRAKQTRPIPDYAFDKHTNKGKSMGRGFDHWLDVGCQLDHPAEVEDPYQERAEALWRSGKNDAPDWGKRRKRKDDDVTQLNLFNS